MMKFTLPLVAAFSLPLASGQAPKPKEPPPKPLFALQLAADVGKTTKLTLRGLRLDTVTEIRLGEPKSKGAVAGKGRKVGLPNPQMNVEAVGDTEIDVEVTFPAEVPGGTVALTAVGPGGESSAMTLLVNDDTPRVAEKEPNEGFKQAMPVAVPTVVEASFGRAQDVDVFRFSGKAGDRIRIDAIAGRAGSPASPLITLHDADGRTLATGETKGEGRDSVIRLPLPSDGAYSVSVIDAHDQGGSMFVYRLAVRRDK